jgi:hypothetical protein
MSPHMYSLEQVVADTRQSLKVQGVPAGVVEVRQRPECLDDGSRAGVTELKVSRAVTREAGYAVALLSGSICSIAYLDRTFSSASSVVMSKPGRHYGLTLSRSRSWSKTGPCGDVRRSLPTDAQPGSTGHIRDGCGRQVRSEVHDHDKVCVGRLCP